MRPEKELCVALMQAETEAAVIDILTTDGLWGERLNWRLFGDEENNYSTIGNQQSRPEAALVEKLVNSIDACLMNKCMASGVHPENEGAPRTIHEAVARFYSSSPDPANARAGQLKNWDNSKRLGVSRDIAFVATGNKPTQSSGEKGNPCFSVIDVGEGQTPARMPDTLLSLNKSNKLKIPFVQGKFNMGGTGVLKFCGSHGLQLIVTRRNPALIGVGCSDDDRQWCFTIVRREDPDGGRRSSVYTYLAPVNANSTPGRGGVLRFRADEMPLFPDGLTPYARNVEWGTLVKMYEFKATGFRSNIIRSGNNFLNRADLLLPNAALPIRFYECRSYGGHKGSFETTLTGIATRLEDDRSENLEEGFPTSCPLSTHGEQMTATIFAFKKGKAASYRRNEGVVFTINGQTHGHFPTDFFRRKKLGMSYLRDSLLVMVDCSRFSGRAREDLFMNSRDRISGGDLRSELEAAIEDMIRQHQGLRELKDRRRREETESIWKDAKPLEEVLSSLLQKSPTLAKLFLKGSRLKNPFKTRDVAKREVPFDGKRHPTHFRFKGKEYGTELVRETAKNMRSRITFETDAVNDYFSRTAEPGEFELFSVNDESETRVANFVGPNLQNGSATLTLSLPDDCEVGDELRFRATVSDPTLLESFENKFTVRVKAGEEKRPGGNSTKKQNNTDKGDDSQSPDGISLPNIVQVFEKDWDRHDPPFDKHSALRVKHAGSDDPEDDNAQPVYDFFVNLDNINLKTEVKPSSVDTELLSNRFMYGLVLVGLALLQQDQAEPIKDSDTEDSENGTNIEDKVEQVCRALAPVLLPMIDSLSEIDVEEAAMPVDGYSDSF